jgi:hypothetical protein
MKRGLKVALDRKQGFRGAFKRGEGLKTHSKER